MVMKCAVAVRLLHVHKSNPFDVKAFSSTWFYFLSAISVR